MDERLPFAEFYRVAVDEALERAGRPDSDLFTKLATAPGINSKYYLRLSRRDILASAEGARDIEPCAFFHPKIKSHFLRYYGLTAYTYTTWKCTRGRTSGYGRLRNSLRKQNSTS